MYHIFSGSQETCPRKNQERGLMQVKEKVLEAGNLETSLGPPTLTLEDPELIIPVPYLQSRLGYVQIQF